MEAKQTLYRLGIISLFCATLLCIGCGESNSTFAGQYRVQDVNILADDIERGESVRVEIFFETKREFDGTPDGTEVVARVPSQLDYVPLSSEIYDGSTEQTDGRSPDAVLPCPDGSQFIIFQFTDADLLGRAIRSDGRFGFRFNVVGRTPVSATYVRAAAGKSVAYSCFAPFSFEEEEAVQVF